MAAGPGPPRLLDLGEALNLASGSAPPEEAYLPDGIIALQMHPTSDLFVQRRVRVVKMRSTKHETGFYALSCEDGAFDVTRSVTGSS